MSHTSDDEIDATDDPGRRWYHPNSTWWMALGWPLLIVVALFPFPWWW